MADIESPIIVTDGTLPVPGASFFVNGTFAGVTDATGTAMLFLTSVSNQVQIVAAGFNPYQATLTFGTIPDRIVLTRTPAASGRNLTLVASTIGATVQIGSETGTISANGTYVTSQQYTPGAYTVSLSLNGSSSVTSIQVIPDQSAYSLVPVTITDAAAGAAPANQTSSQQQADDLLATVMSPATLGTTSVPDYEWVNPTAGYGRYFTATQARMYIGNLFIEELAGVQFVLQTNKVPIYGYAGTEFDAVGNGKALVQGQIMIHFISEGYLYTVLNEYRKLGNSARGDASDQQTFQNLVNAEQNLRAIANPSDVIVAQIAAIQQQRQGMLAENPMLASSYKRAMMTNDKVLDSPNALYQKVPFDLVLNLEGGGRTVTRRISNCILTSNEQILAGSDGNLVDSYGFMGRRLR